MSQAQVHKVDAIKFRGARGGRAVCLCAEVIEDDKDIAAAFRDHRSAQGASDRHREGGGAIGPRVGVGIWLKKGKAK